MFSATSHSDVTLILVDAERGIVEQNLRHIYLASLAGVKHIAILINKMDACEYAKHRYKTLREELLPLLEKLPDLDLRFIPISALHGDNVVQSSKALSWYKGPTVLQYLEGLSPEQSADSKNLRAVVQWIEKEGSSASKKEVVVAFEEGRLQEGEYVENLRRANRFRVSNLHTSTQGPLSQVRFEVNRKVALERGDILTRRGDSLSVSRRLQTELCWMHETAPDRLEQWLNWTVWLRENGVGIGTIEATVKPGHRVEIGYLFDPRIWRRGFGREAVAAMIEHLQS